MKHLATPTTMMDSICRLCMESSNLNHSMSDDKIRSMIEYCIQLKIDVANDLFPVEICDDCYYKIKDFSEFKENCHSIQDMLRQEIEQTRLECDRMDDEIQSQRTALDDLDLFVGDINYSDIEYLDETLLFSDLNAEELLRDLENSGGRDSDLTDFFEPSSVSSSDSQYKKRAKRCYKEEYNAALITCDICGKLVHKTLLPGHINMHNGVKPYACPREGCHSTFHCKHKLKRHIGYKHKDGNFPCDQCEKVFNSNLALYHHKFASHQLRNKACSKCDKRFRTTHGLNRHMQTHSEERKFKCHYCPMAFLKDSVREIHHRTHTKERPFVCTKCGADYNHRRLLVNHMKRKHPGSETVLQTLQCT
ncbi:zinc finger protein 8-like isoform X1 [Uranotaenia lowii]|uniref:zinc finger protein 8-like isoform X1 n=2 Tax=Uranotaenia lowii TaxID=190385 RepID=UPI002478B041|nr:zinc finger protein 8-like isoform X1 [Uranotaenia lowii]